MGTYQTCFPSQGIPKNDTPPAVRSGLQRRDRSRFARDSLLTLSVPSFINLVSYQRSQKTVKHSFVLAWGIGKNFGLRIADCEIFASRLLSSDL